MTDDRLHLSHLGACRTAFRGVPDACSRILIVGEDNPQSSRPEHALFCAPDGVAGHRLQSKIFAIPRAAYLAIWRTNLCSPTWDLRAARERARELLAPVKLHDGGQAPPWNVVGLLGAKVAEVAMEAIDHPHPIKPFERRPWTFAIDDQTEPKRWMAHSGDMVYIPHPSGRCRAWNDPASVHKVRAIMAEVAPEIPWGGCQ